MANNQTAVAKAEQKSANSFLALLEKSKEQIARALPKVMNSDQFMRMALTTFRSNPGLMECDPYTVLGGCIQSAELGLQLSGALGEAYLVPFYNKKRGCKEAQFIPGYKGIIKLCRNTGMVKSLYAEVVYEEDEFQYQKGLDDVLIHKPAMKKDRGEIVAAYAVIKFLNGGSDFDVLPIEVIKDKWQKNTEIWNVHFAEMAKKTMIRRLLKTVPKSSEQLTAAVMLSELAQAGQSQNLQIAAGSSNVVALNYEPEYQASDDATTIAAVNSQPQESPDTPAEADKKAQNAANAHDQAINRFVDACNAAKNAGIEVEKLLKANPQDLINSKDADALDAYSDIIDAKLGKEV